MTALCLWLILLDLILRDFCVHFIYVGYANKVVFYIIFVRRADEVRMNRGQCPGKHNAPFDLGFM